MMETRIATKLKRIIEVLNESKEDYLNASESTNSEMLKNLFLRFASQRIGFASELNGYITLLGNVTRSDENSVIDTLQKTWVDIKQFLSSSKDETILEAMAVSEHKIIEKYDEVLNQVNLDSEYLTLLQKQRTGILESLKELESFHISLAR